MTVKNQILNKSNWVNGAIIDIKVTKTKNGYLVDLFVKFREPDEFTGNLGETSQFVFLNGTDTSDFLRECLCDNQGDTGGISPTAEQTKWFSKTEKITLKNGNEETRIAIASVMLSLNWLVNMDRSIAVRELYKLCKNPCYTLPESIIKYLVELRLINRDGGRPERLWYVQDSVRNIVLSTVKIKGADYHLTIPFETVG